MALGTTPEEIVANNKYPLLAKADHWQRVPLAAVASVQNGFAFKSEYFDREQGVPLIRIRDITESITEHRYNGAFDASYIVNYGDILVGMDGDFLAAKWTGKDALLNQRVCRLTVLSPHFDEKFFFLCLQPFLDAINAETSSVTVKHLSSRSIETIPLPLPPLNEQRRIVSKIEELFSELDKGIESLTTAREQLKVHRQSVLKAAFEGKLTESWRRRQSALPSAEDILSQINSKKFLAKTKRKKAVAQADDAAVRPTVPDAWATTALGSLDVDIFDGPFGSNLKTSDYVEAGVRVIRLENIGYGQFIEEKRSYISAEKYEGLKKHTIFPGDIVVSSFVTDAIRSARVPASVPIAINKADCFAVRFQGDDMIADFAQKFLESRCAYKQMEGMIHGVGRPRINTTQLKQILLPICSREEQVEVLNQLSVAYSEIDALDAELASQSEKAIALRQSILKRAFSGQLVSQDSTDEPASILLERIGAKRDERGGTKRRKNKNGNKEAA